MTCFQKATQPALVLGEIGLVHNLSRAKIPVYVGSEIRDNPSLYSRFTGKRIFFSDYTSGKFIDELCEFGKTQEQKTVIFSDDDHAILNIAQHQKRLEPYFLFTFPPAEKVKKLLDKQLFCELIDGFDLPAPRSVTLSSVAELREKPVSRLTYPCIVKPSFKQAWWNTEFGNQVGDYQKAIKCETYGILKEKYEQIAKVNPHVVVQEFIEGGEDEIYSVNMYVDKSGELRGYFIARKLRTYPIRAGEGSYIVTVDDPEMIQTAMDIAGKLTLAGLLNIQFKRDNRTGKPVLLEIHTRNSAWSYLGTAAGVNVAELYYRDLTGHKPVDVPGYKEDVSFIFLEKDIKAFVRNLKSRQISISWWIGTYLKKFTPAGYLWHDPLPVIMTLYFFLRRRIAWTKSFFMNPETGPRLRDA